VPQLRAEARGDERGHLYLYGSIGGWFGITAAEVGAALGELAPRPITVHVSSSGGDVFDGLAIYNALRHYPHGIETRIDGLAGSIASVIALAGSPVVMAEAAFYMVHEPHGLVHGGAAEARKLAALLDKASGVLASVYVRKTGAHLEAVRALMQEETWYTAQEALDAGFVDEVDDAPLSDDAQSAAAQFDLSLYARVPSALVERPTPEAPAPGSAPPPAAAREREFAALLTRSLGHLAGV
jgi:ATP-dependent protease ClpP protease subunit